mmetsp:Transcript_20895/g.41417  ORF Transcript_20895/g.41417 Transcript_20895/m.41417 type:complete len:220 (+) Transcript_20895:2-661(+)
MQALVKSPAFSKNCTPILEVLQSHFAPEAKGNLLEIASGGGYHTVYFAQAFPNFIFQPTAYLPEEVQSVLINTKPHKNILTCLQVDSSAENWQVENSAFDVMVNINMVHISPWSTCQGLMKGASKALKPGGKLFMYGPFNVGGEYTSEGNRNFDASLRAKDASWGIRNLEDVVTEAKLNNLDHVVSHPMPANNLTLVFSKPMEKSELHNSVGFEQKSAS